MAQSDQENTKQLDLTVQETSGFSQGSANGSSTRANEGVGNQNVGGSEEGKEAETSPGKPSPTLSATLNCSDQADRPDLLLVPSPSSSSSPASALASTLARPNLVQSHSGASASTAATATHPKKFNSVNINKKFLEKTTCATTTTATMTTTSTTTKASASTISRPPAQSSSLHPRLVTTKLTATAPSPSSAPGWSRPSSTGPSAAATGASSPSAPTPAPPIASIPPPPSAQAPTAPQLPHVGKVIQPVPKAVLAQQHAAVSTGMGKETGSNSSSTLPSKPVWSNMKQPSTTFGRADATVNDFPTAAEVAQGMRKDKLGDQPAKDAPASSADSTSKRNEEADTFRGVHLDPNAHHWDEMVEDDDNYWDNVIEFGDGRQYKVEAVEQTSSRSRELSPPSSVKPSHSPRLDSIEVPVTKEERFADDFDRSWPSGSKRAPPSGVQQRSPQESSRVLFNERSNKLEPYSNHRMGHGPYPGKRGSFQERNVSPTESRSGSGAFHHGAPRTVGGPPDFGSNRSRRFSGASNSSFVQPNERDRRDRRDAVPASPRIPKDNIGMMGRTASLRGRDRDSERDFGTLERGRHSTMGPPPIPQHTWRNSSKESTKQHLSTPVSANGPASPLSTGGRRFPSGDGGPYHQNEQSDLPGPSPIARGPLHSPALSHASTKAAWVSPAAPPLPLPALDGHDLEEIKKDVMHSAAERAKQRRQQEEEEREARKERARKKAAELEAKMKAEAEEKARKEEEVADHAARERGKQEAKERDSSSANKDDEALKITNEVVGREDIAGAEPQMQRTTSKPAHRRAFGPNDSSQPRRFNSTGGLATSPSVAETADTWRRPAPLPRQHDEPRLIQRRSSNSVAFLPPPSTPLDHIQTLSDGKKEDLEVVDFTDMDKFVGEPPEQKETPRRPRPVASDFFGDLPSPVSPPQSLLPLVRNDIETWRRKTPLNQGHMGEQSTGADRSATDSPPEQVHKTNEGIPDTRQPNLSPSSNQQRPRPQSYYHQAPMSSLVDAMSRIKGAIHDMHAGEVNRDTSFTEIDTSLASQAQPIQTVASLPSKFKERWAPQTLRRKRIENQEEAPEESCMTATEPPPSPRPAEGNLVVNVPSVRQQREPVHRRRLLQFSKSLIPAYWDILSFDPPVEGMNKRSLSLNDVLFRPPPMGYKGKTKYLVRLPNSRTTGVRNHIGMQPGVKTSSFGGFGKQNGADMAMSWRKPTSQPPQTGSVTGAVESTSRSPPPEPESFPRIDDQGESSNAENSVPPLRIRSQPKMPEGSCVAFYRDLRVDVPEAAPKIIVNFIVSSEIDGSQSQEIKNIKEEVTTDLSRSSEPTKEGATEAQKSSDVFAPKRIDDASTVKIAVSPAEPEPEPSPLPVAEKNSDKPSHESSPWPTKKNLPLKESPARAPDPEHLKAVWSQTSNDKAGLQPVNSLEGIADDLTSLPFTIQDVKSEDGETPPPPPSGLSSTRMSLHEVTRAFQRVPSSSSSAPLKPSISPPSTTAPVARPTPSFSYPVPPNNMRPAYAAYASPILSHSPSPTIMYPHVVSSPVPTRMQPNGHAPMYNPPPMWVPVQPPAQNSNGMMRPMASPYAAAMMPYPANGGPAMYTPTMPANVPGTPQSQNLQANRNRNVPMMSPVMQHAGAPPMYPASPAMMHIQMTPTSGYMPLPAGRGQPRPENGQMNMQQPSSAHPLTSHGFSPVPHSPFMRNW